MSAAHDYDTRTEPEESGGSHLSAAPEAVEVRRNAGLAALVGGVSSAVAIAYFARATGSGAALDWVLFAFTAAIGALHLHSFVDARTPLLVADGQGVRLRLGRAWRGLPWGALASVEHAPRRGLLRDGRLVLVPHNPERVLAELDASGRRQSRVSSRLYGAPFAVPLGLSTRVPRLEEDLTTSLRRLAGSSSRVVELVPDVTEETDQTDVADPTGPTDMAGPTGMAGEPAGTVVEEAPAPERGERFAVPDLRPRMAALIAVLAAPLRRESAEDRQLESEEPEHEEPVASHEPTEPVGPTASRTPLPLREPRSGRRTEVTASVVEPEPEPLEGRELRRPGSVSLVEDTQVWGDRVSPLARVADAVEPLVIDGVAAEPAEDPVIGPEIVAARTRIGITVDRLAERTRIRPHVIEAIEVDDFVPCGGDFYARGHLRTLARVLGLDAAPLLASYDERYADAPINPRRVFEAELATGASGGIRSTRGGPNWSILLAVVMALVLAWSVARLAMDTPAEIQSPAPLLNGSEGPGPAAVPTNVTIKLTAERPSNLVVRNGRGKVVFDAPVEYGEVHRIDVRAPVTVQASDAGAIAVAVDGRTRGTVGRDGQSARKTYRAG
ncbi:helix-turn-helix domain-containing protein [Nocardioides donggukensis]|uniref:DUF4115 domain-containing protein n=1 Tax=Nocardioides donggukensis TaxID=2774019 RepID=A0A927K903_9ACTN|nr:RodZ domain-containing protein [Nocardioides donggukensis]MBD8869845.1 DUF4115 domain-containing protein [Nocardioides donggukensis]